MPGVRLIELQYDMNISNRPALQPRSKLCFVNPCDETKYESNYYK